MGWDITYHPVGADEIQSIYFQGLADDQHYQTLVTEFAVNDFYVEQLRCRFDEARQLEDDVSFQKGHAFYLAIIFGFLRKHHYIRGGAFSFLLDDALMARYIADWKTLVPAQYADRQFDNCLTENYCGGVYLPYEGLKKLRDDYQADAYVRAKMDETFSHGRLAVFWQAVDEAITNNLGLVEAAEVVEPNPVDLNATRSLTNLFNCYPDGALLYAQAARQQFAELQKNNAAKVPEKKGLFARLFRK